MFSQPVPAAVPQAHAQQNERGRMEHVWSCTPITVPGLYRTAGGSEIDLVLKLLECEYRAIDVKRSHAARPARTTIRSAKIREWCGRAVP